MMTALGFHPTRQVKEASTLSIALQWVMQPHLHLTRLNNSVDGRKESQMFKNGLLIAPQEAKTKEMGHDEVKGGAPYGATTIAGADGSRMPSAVELDGARYLGRRVADTAAKLFA